MEIFKFCRQKICYYLSDVIFGTLRLAIPMADHSGYKTHTCISYSLASLKYLNKYALTTNVSAYVKYVNTTGWVQYQDQLIS
jgi:hypothetical protein